VGLEVGWYLRLAKTDRIEALVSPKGEPQVRHESHIFPDWTFTFESIDDYVLAVMTRNTPLFDKESE